ncbi:MULTISPECIES: AAA family ATPase [unclassified Rhodococcus (in: high G+C Gram-positive bacteria)]|uniref:AAA family ATPase n=1 Tax=Rhodococcus sp. SJ-3 TaxID=3454628 RepID=UPI003F7ACC10
MPLLDSATPPPDRPCRIVVAGTSGSGKTTLSARLGDALGIEHIEIDGLHHGPNWTPRPSFVADVEDFTSQPYWVTEWQYTVVRPLLAERADLMIWLDLPRPVVMRQVIRRTLRRRVRREVLWNGNVEPPLHTIFTDRTHIIRWSWSTYGLFPERIREVLQRRPELPIVRLTSRRDIDGWMARLGCA